MNITVENLAPCKKLLRVELDAKAVDEIFDAITKDYQKQASLPGFRPGKAPRDMVLKKYEADIKDDAKRRLIGDNYRKALEEKKISVIGQPDIEEIQFGRGQNLQFAATIETAPEFQLPEYKGLPSNAKSNPSRTRTWSARWIAARSSTRNLRPSRARCRWAMSRW